MKEPNDRLIEFFEPIYVRGKVKGPALLICFFNLGGVLTIIGIVDPVWKPIFIGIAIVLSVLSFPIINFCLNNMIKAIYGFLECVFFNIFGYCATYLSYVAAGYELRPFLIFTQLIGGFITIISVIALLHRLIGSAKELSSDEIARGAIIGYFIGTGFVVFMFVGLLILYYTVFKQNIELVKSSKMLFVAWGTHVAVAYYGLKAFFTIKYHKYIADELKENKKGKKNKKR